MPSAKLTALVDLAGGQVPTDLIYIVDVSAGTSGSKSSTLNDFLAEITKNITDGSVMFASFPAAAVADASKGKIRYSQSAVSSAGSFQVSEAAATYQNLIKGPTSQGVLTANLFPFASAGDVIGDTALCQLGATSSRVANYNAHNPGTALTDYGSLRFAIVDQSGFANLGLLGFPKISCFALGGGTVAAPAVLNADNTLLIIDASAQRTSTLGNLGLGCRIAVYTTQDWASNANGTGITFELQQNSITANNRITCLAINGTGCVHARPGTSPGTAITPTGTLTLFQVGGAGATVDNNAVSFIADVTNIGSTAIKDLVIQQKGSQTGSLLETQSATGVAQFAIKPVSGVACHFLDWVGSVNTPAVSAAGSARLYVNSSGKLQISENGGGYVDVI